jgi:hypothetical protein
VNQQKQWIDQIEPLIASIEVVQAFMSYTPGTIFRAPLTGPGAVRLDGHNLLVIGYDDVFQT